MPFWSPLRSIACVVALLCLTSTAACESDGAGGGDPCEDPDCDPLATCVDLGGAYRCDCPAGYDDPNGDGTSCVDTNECAMGTDDCDILAVCSNVDGGYGCACPPHYDDVNGDGTSCVDINECTESLDNCDALATCENIDGGFTCTCPPDHDDVNGDGTLCEPLVCTTEGEQHALTPGEPPCCAGLTDVGCDALDSGSGTCQTCDGNSVCSNCGNGICGLGENECRCPADCPPGVVCTPEGSSHGISPGAPPCCAGLTDVGCDVPDSNDTCAGCMGASYCVNCGDGICGPGENVCRCAIDCPP